MSEVNRSNKNSLYKVTEVCSCYIAMHRDNNSLIHCTNFVLCVGNQQEKSTIMINWMTS